MMKKLLTVGILALAVATAGCWTKDAGPKEGDDPTTAGPVDFNKLWPKEEIAKLTPGQRKHLLELALVGLKGNNWQHARDVLIALGKDSVPPLIDMVGSDEPSAACLAPAPPETRVKTVGEVAHDVLLEIVVYRSNYRGGLPTRSQEAWQRWWASNGAGLVVSE